MVRKGGEGLPFFVLCKTMYRMCCKVHPIHPGQRAHKTQSASGRECASHPLRKKKEDQRSQSFQPIFSKWHTFNWFERLKGHGITTPLINPQSPPVCFFRAFVYDPSNWASALLRVSVLRRRDWEGDGKTILWPHEAYGTRCKLIAQQKSNNLCLINTN